MILCYFSNQITFSSANPIWFVSVISPSRTWSEKMVILCKFCRGFFFISSTKLADLDRFLPHPPQFIIHYSMLFDAIQSGAKVPRLCVKGLLRHYVLRYWQIHNIKISLWELMFSQRCLCRLKSPGMWRRVNWYIVTFLYFSVVCRRYFYRFVRGRTTIIFFYNNFPPPVPECVMNGHCFMWYVNSLIIK